MSSLKKAACFIKKILTSSTALLTASLVAASVSQGAQNVRRAQTVFDPGNEAGNCFTSNFRKRNKHDCFTAEIPFERLFKAGLTLPAQDLVLLDEIAFNNGGYDAIRLWNDKDAEALMQMEHRERRDYLLHLKAESQNGALLSRLIYAQDGTFHKFDHRFKSPFSVYETLHVRPDGPSSLEEISDLIRYSVIFEPKTYTDKTLRIMNALNERGFELISLWNAWCDVRYPYKAINTVLRNEKGSLIEIQFHTPEGALINDRTHKDYEKRRLFAKNTPQYQKLLKRQFAMISDLETPRNVKIMQTFNHQTNKKAA
ncbi:MAG: hypothetical protein MR571_03605 [Succinatimonas sp.]|nr:hypothetical protein [Succinatimonas sp.]